MTDHPQPIDLDDQMKGRILGRREVLALLGSATAAGAMLIGCSSDGGESPASTPTEASGPRSDAASATTSAATSTSAASISTPSCIVVPALTEGPYFVDEDLNRSDVRSDTQTGTIKPGTPLTLVFTISKLTGNSCAFLHDAKVDIWHCDAQGAYSDVSDNMAGSTRGQNFLRGYQVTDANGRASFTTIYPGWYPGRAVHIHFKIRTGQRAFTSQLFFEDSLSDQVFGQAAYRKSGNRTLNSQDGIYRQGGDVLLLRPAKTSDGYEASFACGMQL